MNNWSRNLTMAQGKVTWNNIYCKDSLPCHENYVKYLIACSAVSTLILKLLLSTNAALSHPIPSPSLICFHLNGPHGATNESKDSVIIIIEKKQIHKPRLQDCKEELIRSKMQSQEEQNRLVWLDHYSAFQPVQPLRLTF